MTRAELVDLLNDRGWQLFSVTENWQIWAKRFGSWERNVMLPANSSIHDYEELLERARQKFAHAEAEWLLTFVMEGRRQR
jgi:hypothetical protein